MCEYFKMMPESSLAFSVFGQNCTSIKVLPGKNTTENASEDSGIILKYSHINFVSLERV
jgi:hypothetical protein